MKVIAIIMARGGSKGLPGKNIKLLCGKPLLAYSIEHAIQSGVCDEVLVTTEDDSIAEVARNYGAIVPFMRPKNLADDTTPPEPVIQHALIKYEVLSGKKFDIVVYLQPTEIFRKPSMIRDCVNKLKSNPDIDTVFSAYKTHKHFWRKSKNGYERLTEANYSARQKRGDKFLFREDQGVACATRAQLIRDGKRVGDKVNLVINEDFRTGIDIHTEFDFWLTKTVYKGWPSTQDKPTENASFLGNNLKDWGQSIRNGYIRSFIVFALHETGVFVEMRKSKEPQTSKQLADKCNVNGWLLDGVLNFLTHADEVMSKKNNAFTLTEKGRKWLFADPILAMSYGAVGAYNSILTELVPCLRNEKKYGTDFVRPGDLIAKGSYYTGKSNYPWVVSKMKELGVKTVGDIGCGYADVLVGFCKLDSEVKGVGVDISPEALDVAGKRIDKEGLTDRIRLVQGDLTNPSSFQDAVKDVDAFNGIMVIHEFLRDGEEYVVDMLKNMKAAFPGKYLFIGEFDAISDEDYQKMPYPDRIHPLFYQHVIHPLTWQGLPIHKEEWLEIFKKADLKLIKMNDNFPFRLVEFILRF